MDQKDKCDAYEIASFLLQSDGKPDLARMRGKVLEHWSHRVVAGTGVGNVSAAAVGRSHKRMATPDAESDTIVPVAKRVISRRHEVQL